MRPRASAGEPDVDDDAVVDLDVAGDEHAAHERGLDVESHVFSPSATRTEPPAPSSRSRASRDRRRRAARRARRARRRLRLRAPRRRRPPSAPLAITRFRRARSRSFAFSGATPDHEACVRPSEPDHRHRRDRVQHELLRRARLEPRRAGDRPPARRRPRSRGRPRAASALPRTQTTATQQRTRRPRRFERGERVRRRAARAHADDRVVGADARARASSASPRVDVVLGVLAVAGDDRDDLARAASRTSARISAASSAASRPDVPAPT